MKKQSDLYCEAQSSLQQSNCKAIKDRALRKKQKLNSKRYEIATKMWEIEMKEIASNCENGLHSSQDFLNCKNEITVMHKNIEKLREERDSWINACKQEGILSDEDLKEFARGINELLSGRNDLETTIKYLDIELEELLGPFSKKKELGTESLQCKIDKELKFEIKELKLDIKGFQDDCKKAESNKDMASKRLRSENGSLNSGTMPPNLKGSCKNRLENEYRRYQTVNLKLEDEVKRKKLLIQLFRCLKKGMALEPQHMNAMLPWEEPQPLVDSWQNILEIDDYRLDFMENPTATEITEAVEPSSGTRSNGSIHIQQRNITLDDLHPVDDSEVSLADMDYYDRGDEQEIEFMGHSILKGLESIAANLCNTIPDIFPQKEIKVNKANEELATIKKNISIGPLINWIPKC